MLILLQDKTRYWVHFGAVLTFSTAPGRPFSRRRSERLDVIPAQFRVIVTRRPKYACRSCSNGIVQAPAPARLIPGGMPTGATVAHGLVSKSKGTVAPVGPRKPRRTPAPPFLTQRRARSSQGAPLVQAPWRGPGYFWALARDGEPLRRHWFKPNGERHGVARPRPAWPSPMRPGVAGKMPMTSCKASPVSCRVRRVSKQSGGGC